MALTELKPDIKVSQTAQQKEYSHVAVLIPCFNEAMSIAKVIGDFQRELPGAKIYVFDNNSTDNTRKIAADAGASVIASVRSGKGNVVRHMFDRIESEIYLMVDGDDTYPAVSAPRMIAENENGEADIIVGSRITSPDGFAERKFHHFGNRLVALLISRLFSLNITDVMSGYRVLSREFVKSIPLQSNGFEIETEMTLQAAAKGFTIKEIPIQYGKRPAGSHSKLNTYSDGILVLKSIFIIFKDFRPFLFFTTLSIFFLIASIAAGIPPILEYLQHRYVYRVPLAILATGAGILSALSMTIGLMLDTLSKYHNENFRQFRRIIKK